MAHQQPWPIKPLFLTVKPDHSLTLGDDQVRGVKLARVATLWACSLPTASARLCPLPGHLPAPASESDASLGADRRQGRVGSVCSEAAPLIFRIGMDSWCLLSVGAHGAL